MSHDPHIGLVISWYASEKMEREMGIESSPMDRSLSARMTWPQSSPKISAQTFDILRARE